MKTKIEITNPKKIFFDKPKITKREVVNYYLKIAPKMLPHILNRPANMLRAPNGILGEAFYQQNMPRYFPDWIDSYKTFRMRGGFNRHVLCNNKETLGYLANEGMVTLHVWNSRTNRLKNPDRIIFDLDPPEGIGGFELVREVAFLLKKYLESKKITPYLMSTGSRGVHVVVPLKPNTDFKEIKYLAFAIAKEMERLYPHKVTTNLRKSKRDGKVFLDYLRNSYGQTVVAPYSIRLQRRAPVAAPIFWTDLHKKDFGPQKLTIKNIFQYLRKGDPWKDMYKNTYKMLK